MRYYYYYKCFCFYLFVCLFFYIYLQDFVCIEVITPSIFSGFVQTYEVIFLVSKYVLILNVWLSCYSRKIYCRPSDYVCVVVYPLNFAIYGTWICFRYSLFRLES